MFVTRNCKRQKIYAKIQDDSVHRFAEIDKGVNPIPSVSIADAENPAGDKDGARKRENLSNNDGHTKIKKMILW